MTSTSNIDGVLVLWGDRLFYPGNRITRSSTPKLSAEAIRQRAQEIRARIEATVARRAPQVMVKVTGGGRGMRAIAAHFRYISKNGRLDIEDERGEVRNGKDALTDLVDDWRYGGSFIADDSRPGHRREAFNIMLSMPRGTDPLAVLRAARAFAIQELADHKYAMVLHDHQANPHVHLSVRAESKRGRRLNPRKADLARWRETFADKLREMGIDAEASWRSVRGSTRESSALWRNKALQEGRLRDTGRLGGTGAAVPKAPSRTHEAWVRIAVALSRSADPADRSLASAIRDRSTVDRTWSGAGLEAEPGPRRLSVPGISSSHTVHAVRSR
jgi:hypothetical protein